MSELNQAPAAEPAQPIVTTELQPDANAAPVDGGAPVGDENAAPENVDPAPQPQPDKRGAQFRFAELTRQRNEAERQAAELRGELSAYRRLGIAPGQQPQTHQAPAPVAEGPPNPDEYYGGATDPQYLADMVDYRVEQRLEAREKVAAQRSEFNSGAERFFGVMDQAAEAASQSDHFAYAPDALKQIGRDKFTADVLTAAENPVHVAAYLGENPKILKQVMAMPPHQRAYQIAQIDLSISHALKQPTPAPAPSVAPAPAPTPAPSPTPVLPNGRTAMAFNPQNASFKDYEARAQKI